MAVTNSRALATLVTALPLLLRETEVDIYADDTTIWLSGANYTEIQQTVNVSLMLRSHQGLNMFKSCLELFSL